MSDQTLKQTSYPERVWNLLKHWRKAWMLLLATSAVILFCFFFISPSWNVSFTLALEGFICSFQYPSLMAVGPRKRQFADTNNTSCPFVPCSAEALSLCPNPLSYLCRQQGPRLMNLLMFPGDYENQETSLRMI